MSKPRLWRVGRLLEAGAVALALVALALLVVPGAAATSSPPKEPSTAPTQGLASPSPSPRGASAVPQGAREVPGEIIVGLKAPASAAQVQSLAANYGARLVASIDPLNIHLLRMPETAIQAQTMQALAADPAVRFVEPNGILKIFEEGGVSQGDAEVQATPNDPYRGLQWALTTEKAYEAWNYTRGSPRVLVAVVDTGIDYRHPDLDGKYAAGYDFVNSDSDPMDDHGHGTHVAGKIAAETNNGYGIAGLSWYSRLLAVKVCDAGGSCTWADVAQGIAYAADNGAKIINLSLGGATYSTALRDAVRYAYNRGALLVAAAGNTGDYQAIYPAAFAEVVSVACTTQGDTRCWFSTYHSTVELAAPGESILSTIPRASGYFDYMSGTSMSAPDVSGIAALVFARFPAKTNAQVRQCLQRGVDDLGVAGRDIYYGYGRVNALKAVQCGEPIAYGTVQGVVRGGPANERLPGAQVRLVGTSRTATTDSNGVYRMNNVVMGTRQFTASKSGYVSQTKSVTVLGDGSVNLHFGLPRARVGIVQGVVRGGAANERLPGAQVQLVGTSRTATTDSNGVYRFSDVLVGTRQFTASKSGYTSRTQSITVIEGRSVNLHFGLPRARVGIVQGVVRGVPTNAPLPGAQVQLVGTSRTATTDSNGVYRFSDVPVGTRQFTASKSGYTSRTQSITVIEGRSVNLHFRLPVP